MLSNAGAVSAARAGGTHRHRGGCERARWRAPAGAWCAQKRRDQFKRRCISCVSHAACGPALCAQAGAQEAVALLREQLRLRESEVATLRSARPGTCARCAEVALALAAHPTFRPRTSGAADWDAWEAGAGGGSGVGRALRTLLSAPPRLALFLAAFALWVNLLDFAALPLLAAYATALAAAGGPGAPPGARATLLLGGAGATAALAAPLLALRRVRLAAAAAAYAAWALGADGAARRGGRPVRSLRRSGLWRALAAARRVTLHKTAELDPGACHVIAYAPAGHVSAATLLAFAAPAATGFAASFPRVDARVMAPPGCAALAAPGALREALLAMGVAEGSDAGLVGALGVEDAARPDGGVSGGRPGRAVVVPVPLPGGPAAAGAPPAPFDAAVAARRRVARAALRAGACVVPAYGFGDAHDSELPAGAAAAAARLLGVAPPGVPGALAPLAASLAARLAPRLPPWAAAPLRRIAASMAPAAPPGVRVVIGTPFACPRVAHPSDALVDDVAARIWRETAALAAAHASVPDDDDDSVSGRVKLA